MKKIIIYYNFIIVTIMVVMGFVAAQNISQLVSAILFYPLALYFGLLVLPKRNKAIHLPKVEVVPVSPPPAKQIAVEKQMEQDPQSIDLAEEGRVVGMDIDRRAFLKIIGSAGLTLFMFSLFTKKAHGAFFGSAPTGPGIVGVKDSQGQLIDPAQHQPTDGYRITELDDSTPAYYGFTNKDGAWFIMREESNGAYRYTKGDLDFSGNWSSRDTLTYGYFEAVF